MKRFQKLTPTQKRNFFAKKFADFILLSYVCNVKTKLLNPLKIGDYKMKAFKNQMSELMKQAWMFVRKYGMTMSEAMKQAWKVLKLKALMKKGIVRFYFRKIDGSVREAYGTLMSSMLPPTKGTGSSNPTTQCYYDTEKEAYRCFKVANLLSIA